MGQELLKAARLLDVNLNITVEELKKKWREIAKKTHPDHQGGDDEEFKKYHEAYQILNNFIKNREIQNSQDKMGGLHSPWEDVEIIMKTEVIFSHDIINEMFEKAINELKQRKIHEQRPSDPYSRIFNSRDRRKNETAFYSRKIRRRPTKS